MRSRVLGVGTGHIWLFNWQAKCGSRSRGVEHRHKILKGQVLRGTVCICVSGIITTLAAQALTSGQVVQASAFAQASFQVSCVDLITADKTGAPLFEYWYS